MRNQATRRLWPCALVALCLLFGGCRASPSAIVDDGVQRGMTESEASAQGVVAEGKSAMDALSVLNGTRISEVLTGEGGKRLRVDAVLEVPDVQEACVVQLRLREVDIEWFKQTIWGELAEKSEPTEELQNMNGWTLDRGAGAHENLSWYRESSTFSNLSYDVADGSLANGGWGEEWMPDIPTPDARAAQSDFAAFLARLGIKGFAPWFEHSNSKTGTYTMDFIPQYAALPAVPGWRDEVRRLSGNATYSQTGLVYLSLGNLLEIVEQDPVPELLSPRQALDIAQKHLGVDLLPPPDRRVETISLRHQYALDPIREMYTAKPVWYFFLRGNPLQGGSFGAPSKGVRKNYDGSFTIDAQSGILDVIDEIILYEEEGSE